MKWDRNNNYNENECAQKCMTNNTTLYGGHDVGKQFDFCYIWHSNIAIDLGDNWFGQQLGNVQLHNKNQNNYLYIYNFKKNLLSFRGFTNLCGISHLCEISHPKKHWLKLFLQRESIFNDKKIIR